MQIDLSAAEETEIRNRADALGYDSAEHYLVDLALTATPEASADELKASANRCDRGMADADAGRGVSAREALSEIAKELNLANPNAS